MKLFSIILVIHVFLPTLKSQVISVHIGDTNYMRLVKNGYYEFYQFKLNIPNGYYKLLESDSDTVLSEGYYYNGLEEGVHIKYYFSSEVIEKITNYEEGKKSGLCYIYFPSPSVYLLAKAFYVNDTIHGDYLEYFPDGQIKSRYKYDMGVSVDTTVFYYVPGKTKWIAIYDTVNCTSRQFYYYFNGQLQSQTVWRDSQIIGDSYYYDECGNLQTVLIYTGNENYPIIYRYYFEEEPHSFHFYELWKK